MNESITNDFYYSDQQKLVRDYQGLPIPKAIINNKLVEYTEMTVIGKGPFGVWKDYVFLGSRCLEK